MIGDFAGEEGLSRVLSDLELSPAILERSDSPLLYSDYYKFLTRAAEVTGRRSIGLKFGTNNDVTTLGMFGEYIAAAPDLLTGLKRTAANVRRDADFSRQFLQVSGDEVRLGYINGFQGAPFWRHAADTMISYMIGFLRSRLSEPFEISRIEVSYPSGPWEQDVEDCFGAPIHFGCDADSIVFGRHLLSAPQRGPLPSARVITNSDIEREKQALPTDFMSYMSELIYQHLLFGRTDIDSLGSKIGLGPRTIQRKLSETGTSYRTLLEIERRKRAQSLLKDQYTVSEIANDLGYASHTQFLRAFGKWTGMTPGKYRDYISNAETGSPPA
ncbi:MAG: AraC family transcriptional regulator ligand-binding domain-containing protein [Hyphomicrobiales bacterium]